LSWFKSDKTNPFRANNQAFSNTNDKSEESRNFIGGSILSGIDHVKRYVTNLDFGVVPKDIGFDYWRYAENEEALINYLKSDEIQSQSVIDSSGPEFLIEILSLFPKIEHFIVVVEPIYLFFRLLM
jgi:hypothetical protein